MINLNKNLGFIICINIKASELYYNNNRYNIIYKFYNYYINLFN